MSARSTIGRRLAGRLARIGTAVALAAGLVTAVNFGAAQPASAEQSCPTTGVGDIDYWIEQYKDRGVTDCWGMDTAGGLPQLAAVVQVVDLADGAAMTLLSTTSCTVANPCSVPPTGNTLYTKRTAEEWTDLVGGSRLFSSTNAGFFTDTANPTTKLSLPEVTSRRVWTLGSPSAFDLTLNKTSLRMGQVGGAGAFQSVRLDGFPASYTSSNVYSHFGCTTTGQTCTSFYGGVGFSSTAAITGDPNSISRRTMVGVNAQPGVQASRVYILTTAFSYKLADARAFLQHFGSQTEMQLDGGGSTQSVSDYHNIQSTVFRPVPQVLQVLLAP